MQNTVLDSVSDHQTKVVGKQVFTGTLFGCRTTYDDSPLVSFHYVLHPVMVRPLDNNKYRPHDGGGMKQHTLLN